MAGDCADRFQRSSSGVEGRNGQLALHHHGRHRRSQYCIDDDCDCRRVIVKVVGRHGGAKVWATISYGCEKAAFYRKWSTGTKNAPEWHRPTLDPLNPQSPHAHAFLNAFEQMIQDKTYVDRLKGHYTMFRASDTRRRETMRRRRVEGLPRRPDRG